MRFTSLIIELIRARPRLVVWLVALFQAALWLILAMLLYRSPPGDLATVLAYGREYQVGTYLGPPLAFWLADIAFRAAGNHMLGVYLLAQLCGVATFWTLYLLARAVIGGQQAVLAVLLTMTVVAFGWSNGEFGPLVLARPLDEVCGRGPILVGDVVTVRVREEPTVEDATDDHIDSARRARVEQHRQRTLFEERVTTGEQQTVDVELGDKAGRHLRLVHSSSERADQPFFAHTDQLRECALSCVVLVIIGVVHEDDVDSVEPKAFEALLERATGRAGRVVEYRMHVGEVHERRLLARTRFQKPPDFGRQHELIARSGGQRCAEAPFREPVPV